MEVGKIEGFFTTFFFVGGGGGGGLYLVFIGK